ncbi:MAG: transcription-repair coupling factor [Lachnospiraceae bacterium]
MQALLTPLYELAEYNNIQDSIKKNTGMVSVSGCVDAQKWHMAYSLSSTYKYKLIVTYGEKQAKDIFEQYKWYDKNTYLYPAKDLIFYQVDIHGNQQVKERIRVIKRILQKKPITIITTFDALMAPQIPLEHYEESIITLKKGFEISLPRLAEKLVALGYEKVFQVELQGQFSIRGDIVDIFDLTEDNPVRLEFFGDEIESIRSFDIETQRSMETLFQTQIFPAMELILSTKAKQAGMDRIKQEAQKQEAVFRNNFQTEAAHRIKTSVEQLEEDIFTYSNMANLDSYLHYFYDKTSSLLTFFDATKTMILIDEPTRIKEHVSAVELEFKESMTNRLEKGYILPGQTKLLYTSEETVASLGQIRTVLLSIMETKNSLFHPKSQFEMTAKTVSPYNRQFELLVKDIIRYKKLGYRMILLSPSQIRAKRLAESLREYELSAVYTQDPYREAIVGEVLCLQGNISRGFEYPMIKLVVIAETDIFGTTDKKAKKKQSLYKGTKITDFSQLHVGDYVVHESYGLGQYLGMEKKEADKVVRDYMKIAYHADARLYVPATGLHLLQKYSSQDAKVPKLTKLGTKEWTKTTQKVRQAVETIAKDLVELYAKRQHSTGFQYGEDTVWQKEFEEMFPFEETQDQITAIDATKDDMQSTRIMDRLICGDVGYGKTEIAIRAAFKAVQEGKQVVYLVPTTILAQQHYNTFIQRMKDFPIRVDLMCRFRTRSEQNATLEGLRKGFVDIVIGTHRVLSKDMEYKDLGLLIIDEEQRFGVGDKEKIKKLKENLDVLTLTATPIPRTLHMSLIGVRDMSLLEEAPQERTPIQTYVMEYNDEMVREAITRELNRGGQVYYVYNRVNNIELIAASVQALVPDAVVAFAHGQMREHELERIMFDFVNGDIDVLVSTTIIETGMDISNANTMIIDESDGLGLSQLYQLRGRVGRSNRTAYAFMMYKRGKLLKEVAEKRLQAIKEFTELGSGFKIAMRDLEIRGAGNILGKVQHGHMEAVGYDMYCRMLNEAIELAQGKLLPTAFNTQVSLHVDAYIPDSYIVNEVQKLDIYKRIAGVETEQEKEDIMQELVDRFGNVPKSVDNLIRINIIRTRANLLHMVEIKNLNEKVHFIFREDIIVDAVAIVPFMKRYKGKMKYLTTGQKTFTYKVSKSGVIEIDGKTLLEDVEDILTQMETGVILPQEQAK